MGGELVVRSGVLMLTGRLMVGCYGYWVRLGSEMGPLGVPRGRSPRKKFSYQAPLQA
jgi:hypothetical protein